MIILGLNAYHPDAAVALIKDGQLIWAGEEERYNRIKHSSGFPCLALRRCFEETQIAPEAVDYVAISKDPRANLLRKIMFVFKKMPKGEFVSDRITAYRTSLNFMKDYLKTLQMDANAIKTKFIHIEHHRAHVASSFFASGFERAALFSFDGLGDFSSANNPSRI